MALSPLRSCPTGEGYTTPSAWVGADSNGLQRSLRSPGIIAGPIRLTASARFSRVPAGDQIPARSSAREESKAAGESTSFPPCKPRTRAFASGASPYSPVVCRQAAKAKPCSRRAGAGLPERLWRSNDRRRRASIGRCACDASWPISAPAPKHARTQSSTGIDSRNSGRYLPSRWCREHPKKNPPSSAATLRRVRFIRGDDDMSRARFRPGIDLAVAPGRSQPHHIHHYSAPCDVALTRTTA